MVPGDPRHGYYYPRDEIVTASVDRKLSCIRKVKVLKKPKFDIVKFMELHGDMATAEDKGELVDQNAAEAQEGVKGSGGRL
mmetsp:Transcript_14762/g.44462  ORF Transcript_14762/g.44462 Transcript_14762/m.44462 type:complete len:81 (-) Transcript_14762:103-345(-)